MYHTALDGYNLYENKENRTILIEKKENPIDFLFEISMNSELSSSRELKQILILEGFIFVLLVYVVASASSAKSSIKK